MHPAAQTTLHNHYAWELTTNPIEIINSPRKNHITEVLSPKALLTGRAIFTIKQILPPCVLRKCSNRLTVYDSISLIHPWWSSTESVESPNSLTPRFSNSGAYAAILPSSVVHTGVKSPDPCSQTISRVKNCVPTSFQSSKSPHKRQPRNLLPKRFNNLDKLNPYPTTKWNMRVNNSTELKYQCSNSSAW